MGHLSKSVVTVGVGALLIASGGAYALASSSSTKITVCVSHRDGALYKAQSCANRDSQLSWNQSGPRGPIGPKGDTGLRGPRGVRGLQGLAGPGYHFTISNASPAPSPGMYFIVVAAQIDRGANPQSGYCAVGYVTTQLQGSLFAGAFALPDNNAGGLQPPFSFSGIATVPSDTQNLTFHCDDTAGNSVNPSDVSWAISPLGS
jgi:hypothetical protein